jgi:hypothetical protein
MFADELDLIAGASELNPLSPNGRTNRLRVGFAMLSDDEPLEDVSLRDGIRKADRVRRQGRTARVPRRVAVGADGRDS